MPAVCYTHTHTHTHTISHSLTDAQKRRAYDSKELSKDIDDSIPADKKPADDEV